MSKINLTRWTPDDSGGFYSENGEYVPYKEIDPFLRLYIAVKRYGFPDGTGAGDDIAEILEEIEKNA